MPGPEQQHLDDAQQRRLDAAQARIEAAQRKVEDAERRWATLVQSLGFSGVARHLGVTSEAVRRRVGRYLND